MTPEIVILTLKVAVIAVTLLLLTSLVVLARGNYLLHGRINTAFFFLTLAALLGLEGIARLWNPTMFSEFLDRHKAWNAMYAHLAFSVPAALLLPLMLWTGKTHRRELHLFLAGVFSVLWTGTVITGVFFLPHTLP